MLAGLDRDHRFRRLEDRGWERAAPGYGEFLGAITARLAPAIVDAAEPVRGARVLDVATGPGHTAAEARRRGADVLAVDRSAGMLALARRLDPGLATLQADALDLPLDDASMDAVVAAFYLNHVDDPRAGVAELARVIRGRGRLAATIWDAPSRARHNGLISEAVAEVLGPELEKALPAPSRPLTGAPDALIELVRSAGLVRASVRRLPATVTVADAGELLEGMRRSTARTAALIESIPPHARTAVLEELDRRTAGYRRGEVLRIPVPALLVVAVRP
jgi:SAM-dependent methyltransferase